VKLVWFRRDLRAIDNSALNKAIGSGEPVIALFVATPDQWHKHHMSPRQADLIYRRLSSLQQELELINVPLLYAEVSDYMQSASLVKDIAGYCAANEVLVNREYEVNELERDELTERLLQECGIGFQSLHDKCILPAGALLNKQGGYFKVFTPFKKAWLANATVPKISKTLKGAEHSLSSQLLPYVWNKQQSFTFQRESSECWPVDFEFIRSNLRAFCQDHVADYHELRDFPALDATSSLSPYLAIGALSARQCMARLYAESDMGILSQGAQTWLSELIWREFYQHLMTFEPKLCKGKDFLGWGARLNWWQDKTLFTRWCNGKTGYPIVDASMRQLNETGWMHNRLRMIAASFLTKDLHLDWRWGERYFMGKLIDGDYAANNGGWQWCASTGCDGQPYFRIFNPVTQGEKFDPRGSFIKQWIPELKAVPDKYIHTPWKCPDVKSLLYPSPIVDHKAEREVTLQMYKEAKDNEIHVA